MEGSIEGLNISIEKRELFRIIKDSGFVFEEGRNLILTHLSVVHPNLPHDDSIIMKIDNFLKIFKRYWKESHRSQAMFLTKNAKWLDGSLILTSSARPKGRPRKLFNDASQSTKNRMVSRLVEENSLEELCHAVQIKMRQEGKRDAANFLKDLVASPRRATKFKKSYNRKVESSAKFTPNEALSLIVSANLTKQQYLLLRKGAIEKMFPLYPSYNVVLDAKKSCYPPDSSVIISDSMGEIELQALVDLTVTRFFMADNPILSDTLKNDNSYDTLNFLCKWGCDGCGGLNKYKQLGSDKTVVDDSAALITSFVPIQLYAIGGNNDKFTLWHNPRTSSTRYCRPVRFRFIKETADEIVNEVSYVSEQIEKLRPTEVEVFGRKIKIKSEFLLTMVDGKVCNALSSNRSSQKCFISGVSSKNMNNLSLNNEVSEEFLSWGLSPLHAYIRFMECVLHISYKLEIKKWIAHSLQEKENVKKRKKQVIDKFRSQTGLLLDTPKQGLGNTNDGNSARRFFSDPETCSSITGVDRKLIERFRVILKVLASAREVNTNTFKKYISETAELYVSLYDWYPMSVTVHKILIHGIQIIENFLIPIGQLSEDVIEIRHKEFRKFRDRSSRKNSRLNTHTDVLHCLLVTSDPLITSLRIFPPPQKTEDLDDEVLKLLANSQSEFGDDGNDSDFGLSDMSL